MEEITFQGQRFFGKKDETVLECLLRGGVNLPHSCKSGICQSCLVKVKSGPIDSKAQKGLRNDQISSGLICSCQQFVTGNLELVTPGEGTNQVSAKIIKQEHITDSVVLITLQPEQNFEFRAGQFVNLIREDGLCRSYSIASLPEDQVLCLHVRKLQDGLMSTWLYDENLIGQFVTLNGPIGACYYREDDPERDLILAGTGTGLAPLYGIIRDALQSNHLGKIQLIHGARNPEGLYFVEQFIELEKKWSQFTYQPCVLEGDAKAYTVGNISDLLKKVVFRKEKAMAYFCGDPLLVKKMKQTIFLQGLPSKMIFSDPFISSNQHQGSPAVSSIGGQGKS